MLRLFVSERASNVDSATPSKGKAMFFKSIVALAAIVAVGTWAFASIHADAALKTLGPMGLEAQIDTVALMKTAKNIPTQSFAAF